MKKLFSPILAAVVLVLLLCACAQGGQQGAPTPAGQTSPPAGEELDFHWKAQSVEGEGTPRYIATEHFCDIVRERTGGRVDIELYSSGTLHGTKEGLEAIQNGLTEATFTNPDYMAGNEPMLKVFCGRTTDLSNDFDDTMELLNQTEHLVQESYDNMGVTYVGTVVCTPGEAFHTNVRVSTLEDLSKLTVRTAAMGQELFEAIGATVVNLDMNEVYNAAQLNVINAFEVGGYMDNYVSVKQEQPKTATWKLLRGGGHKRRG